jgi:hypothetical protein
MTHAALSPPRDASCLPQGPHAAVGAAILAPNKLPIRLANPSALAMPWPGAQVAALLLATKPNSSTASSFGPMPRRELNMSPAHKLKMQETKFTQGTRCQQQQQLTLRNFRASDFEARRASSAFHIHLNKLYDAHLILFVSSSQ